MNVKLNVNVEKVNKISFPIIMKSKVISSIVLFTGLQEGFYLNIGNEVMFKYTTVSVPYTETSVWEKYDGTIELSND